MYRYEKKESKTKRVVITILLMIITSIVSIYVYKMYSNINIKTPQGDNGKVGDIVRLSAEKNENPDISSTLEDVTKCVVGISKIKNKGDSIFETDAAREFKFRYRDYYFR